MEDEIAYPGLVGAGIAPAQRSPYDRSFAPGEATTEDVRQNLLEMFLSGLGLVKGGVLTPRGEPMSAGSRVRDRGMRSQRAAERDMARARARSDDERLGYTRTEGPFKGKFREGVIPATSFEEWAKIQAAMRARERAARRAMMDEFPPDSE